MQSGNRYGLFLLVCMILSACGFEPMYGSASEQSGADVKQYLARTGIGAIPDREGQYLRNALIDRFYLYGRPSDPVYRLEVEPVRERLRDLDITKSSDATRGQLSLYTKIILRNADGEKVFVRDLSAITSYNILASEFSTRVSEQNARENALEDLARQIETQLGLFYRRVKPG